MTTKNVVGLAMLAGLLLLRVPVCARDSLDDIVNQTMREMAKRRQATLLKAAKKLDDDYRAAYQECVSLSRQHPWSYDRLQRQREFQSHYFEAIEDNIRNARESARAGLPSYMVDQYLIAGRVLLRRLRHDIVDFKATRTSR